MLRDNEYIVVKVRRSPALCVLFVSVFCLSVSHVYIVGC